MRRAPIVLGSTALGLTAVVAYHTAAPTATTATAASPGTTTTRTRTQTVTTGSSPATRTRSSTTAAATRTAVGQDVDYQYGDLQLKVTERGTKITEVTVERIDVRDPRSQSIDQDALPELEQQALSAQSASIDGVSGASYTSQAYKQSLQSALDKL